MAAGEDVLDQAAQWQAAGEQVALATVVQTWGSSPRPVGSQLAVTAGGRLQGSVSGGCIESAVAEAALETLRTGRPRLLDFGVTNARAWEVGLACGGEVKVLVEPVPGPALLAELGAARQSRRGAVVATRIEDGDKRLLLGPVEGDRVAAAAQDCLASGASRRMTLDGADWFLHVHAPPPQLIVVGAVHIAQSLAPMAVMVGAEVVVCDPRGRYATDERFPGIRLRHEWPDAAIRLEQPGRNSAVVALSHDPKFDDPALEAALATSCGYIGALGSRRSHQARLGRLAERGIAPAQLARILGPVGLDIQAVGAGEIAVSILAEWIAQRRGGPVRPRPPA